jgi:hypothetical protein
VDKLRPALLDSRETRVISEQNLGSAKVISSLVLYRLKGNCLSLTHENELLHTSPLRDKTVRLKESIQY